VGDLRRLATRSAKDQTGLHWRRGSARQRSTLAPSDDRQNHGLTPGCQNAPTHHHAMAPRCPAGAPRELSDVRETRRFQDAERRMIDELQDDRVTLMDRAI
jgi:hypothetical protein